jgi:dihydroneopterin aldolase
MDIVYIRGLALDAVIGIHDWEREIRQPIVLDVEMASDVGPAAASDAIEQALDYAAVAARLSETVNGSEFFLIETLAETVATLIREEFGVPWVRLRVSKPEAVAQAQDVGVLIERGERR